MRNTPQTHCLPERSEASIEAAIERLMNELDGTADLVSELENLVRFMLLPLDGATKGCDASAARPVTSQLVVTLDTATGRAQSINDHLRAMIRAVHR